MLEIPVQVRYFKLLRAREIYAITDSLTKIEYSEGLPPIELPLIYRIISKRDYTFFGTELDWKKPEYNRILKILSHPIILDVNKKKIYKTRERKMKRKLFNQHRLVQILNEAEVLKLFD